MDLYVTTNLKLNKSNQLVYCVKEESNFSKGISGDLISSKFSKNIPSVFYVETTPKGHFHVVST